MNHITALVSTKLNLDQPLTPKDEHPVLFNYYGEDLLEANKSINNPMFVSIPTSWRLAR